MFNRYQEYDEFVHNIDDSMFVSTELCLFVRSHLAQYIPIGSFVSSLEKRIGQSINHQKLLNAYLYVDALTAHTYDFYCVICGLYPAIHVMYINRKISFKCPASDLELPEKYDETSADLVNTDTFWDRVGNAMLLRGFPERKVQEFEISPDMLFWAPFIGRDVRRGVMLFNTEHRKVNKSSGELEDDCKEMTEERLYEMLHHATLHELQKQAKDIGLKAKGTKLEIIQQIKFHVSKDFKNFTKVFTNVWGSSGGWLSATCEHGVVYALKFLLRCESPRGFVDVLLSLKHRPNVVIVDMANMVVAHGNKRLKGMFSPFQGMVAEPTEKNIRLAKSGNFKVSFPFLREYLNESKSLNYGSHPGTNSNIHLCLFDRFHEGNCKGKQEVLRRVTLVEEFHSFVNTQLAEQLYSTL